jgi:hypothetical protein
MPGRNRAEPSPAQALYRRARRTKSQGRLRARAQRPLPILGACSGEVRGTMGETGATPLSAYNPPPDAGVSLDTSTRRILKTKGGRATHPRFRTDGADPVSEGGNAAEVFADMLLADPADRNDPAARQRLRDAEDFLGHEDTLSVMAKRTVAVVGDDQL